MTLDTRYHDQRLTRIEEKIDKLAETVVAIARAEEKLVNIENDNANFAVRLSKVENKVDAISSKVDQNLVGLSIASKIFWIVITAVITTGIVYLAK